MKIALAQLNFTIADISGNTSKIIESIQKAKTNGADLVVFSEMAVCGYPADDLLDYPHFIEECEKAIHQIAEHCQNIVAIVGSPVQNKKETGKRLFNAACILENGSIRHTVCKTLLPTYDVFNEARYFEVNNVFETVEIKGKKIAVTICEDLWHEMDRFDYLNNPLKELSNMGPDFILNISASPYNSGKKAERLNVLKRQVLSYGLPLIYVNQTGVHSDLIFDGNSLVIDRNGETQIELKTFEEDFFIFDTENKDVVKAKQAENTTEEIYRAIVYGIQNFFEKNGFKTAVLGSSGGIDSAVVQALASAAIGAENVKAVLMPSEFSSTGSVEDARALSENLGNPYHVLPIHDVYSAFEKTVSPLFKDLPFNVAEENIQARSRAVLLMSLSNKFGDILLNTSNKSEMAVGYTTLYGDMCGSLCAIGDVYKTEVYKLAHYINKDQELIPNAILQKAPSAELRPGQKDSDSLPEYDVLDLILELYIEKQYSPEQIIQKGYDKSLVEKIIRMVNRNEYKRFQAAPILRVSGKSFGRGRVIPLVSRW